MSKGKDLVKGAKKKARNAKGLCDYLLLTNSKEFKETKILQDALRRNRGEELFSLNSLDKMAKEINSNKVFKKIVDRKIEDMKKDGFNPDSVVHKNNNRDLTDENAALLDAVIEILVENDPSITPETATNLRRMVSEPDFKEFQFINNESAFAAAGSDVPIEFFEKTMLTANEGHMMFSSPIVLEKLISKLGRAAPISTAVIAGQSGVMKHALAILARSTNRARADKYNEHTNLTVMEERDQILRELSSIYMADVDPIFMKMRKDEKHKNYGKKLVFGHNDRAKNSFYENEINDVFNRFDKHHQKLKRENMKKYSKEIDAGEFDKIPQLFNFDDIDITGLDPYAVDIVKAQYKMYDVIAEAEYRFEVDGSIHPKMLQFSSPKPRIHKSELIQNFLSNTDDSINTSVELTNLFEKAILNAQPHLVKAPKRKNADGDEVALSRIIADGYVRALSDKAHGIDAALNGDVKKMLENGNFEGLMTVLSKEAERLGNTIDADNLKYAAKSLAARHDKNKQGKDNKRFTKRMVLDESTSIVMANGKEIKISDFIENNTEMLLKTELMKHSARLGAAKNGIKNLRETIEEYKKMIVIESRVAKTGMSQNQIDMHIDQLEGLYRELNGESHFPLNTASQQTMRFLRNWQIAVSMGRLFLSQMYETSKAVSYSSMGDVLKSLPAIIDYRDLVLQFKEEEFNNSVKDGMAKHIIDDLYNGHLQKQTIQILGYENDFAAGNYKKDNIEQNKANKVMDKVVHWTMKFNAQFDTKLRMLAAMSQIRQLDRYANGDEITRGKIRKGMYSDKRLGLENFKIDDINEISNLIKEKGLRDANGNFIGFSHLNFTGNDKRTFKKYRDYLQKMSKRIVVDKDYSNLPTLQFNPLYKTVMQFRDHGIASINEELIYNMRSGADAISLKFAAYGMAMGAMIYITQIMLAAVGREDREEFLAETLSIKRIMAGAFSRVGYAHPFAATYDTIMSWGLGRDAIFNHRMSGHATDFFDGTPLIAHLQAMMYLAQMSSGADINQGQSQKAINLFLPNYLFVAEGSRWVNKNIVNPKDE